MKYRKGVCVKHSVILTIFLFSFSVYQIAEASFLDRLKEKAEQDANITETGLQNNSKEVKASHAFQKKKAEQKPNTNRENISVKDEENLMRNTGKVGGINAESKGQLDNERVGTKENKIELNSQVLTD